MAIFDLGRLVATASIAKRMEKESPFNFFVNVSVQRFKEGDWGSIAKSDKMQNDESLKNGEGSIHGVYKMPVSQDVIWIFMEWDHKTTTILFPEEW